MTWHPFSTVTLVMSGVGGLIWRGEAPFKTTLVITASGILQLVDGQPSVRLPASRLPAVARVYDAMSGALSGDISRLDRDFKVDRMQDADGAVILADLFERDRGHRSII